MEEKHSIRNSKDFFNDDDVFEKYLEHRRRPENPNECIEKPIILDLLEGRRGRVLDIGCGYGDIAESLLENGMSHYTGIDSSQRMIDLAKSTINNPNADFKVADIQSRDFQAASAELVIARLVLHYVKDLESLFDKIHSCLVPNGHFIFSVEHPVITSSIDTEEGKKKDRRVDNYFSQGERLQFWMGNEVVKYHRTVEEYWRLLKGSGFQICEMREGLPMKNNFQNADEYQRRMRIPLFLIIKATRV